MSDVVLSVSEFVSVFNQTLENAYPSINIVGELANFHISKNKWVYFDLKDKYASVKFFATVYKLPGPLEDGLVLQVSGSPSLHPMFGFSINVQSIKPVGEGSLRRAAILLEIKLRREGLFDDSRKRELPYPPNSIGLITSGESAAYFDFMKIINARWSGLNINFIDVQVQGDRAPEQIISALNYYNSHEKLVDAIIITRGGGSAEDLAVFNNEQLTRAVSASRIPTLVAIGHEADISLAELAADKRASTPSNAAELLVPDKRIVLDHMTRSKVMMGEFLITITSNTRAKLVDKTMRLADIVTQFARELRQSYTMRHQILTAYNPASVLKRGYAVIRSKDTRIIKSVKRISMNDKLDIELNDGFILAKAEHTRIKSKAH